MKKGTHSTEPSDPQSEPIQDTNADLVKLLIESVRDYAIITLDPEGNILTWNPAAAALKGWRAGEIIGKHFTRFYTPEDIEKGKPKIELETAARVGRFEDEGWRMRKDGTKFWANVILTALRDEQGN